MIFGVNSNFSINLRDMVAKKVNIQSVLQGNGAAFDLLDIRKMFKDVDGNEQAGAVGDTVRRIDSYVEGVYLFDDTYDGAVLENYNDKLVVRFNTTRFQIAGFDPAVRKPVIAHGTMEENAGTLYWYNRPGTGYGPRKWGVIIRDGQYRTFHNNGYITVVGVPEWNSYHDVYLNRVDNRITIDGSIQSFTNTSDEEYDPEDGGFRIGGYNGTSSGSFTGILTYFVISDSPLNSRELSQFAEEKREYLEIS